MIDHAVMVGNKFFIVGHVSVAHGAAKTMFKSDS